MNRQIKKIDKMSYADFLNNVSQKTELPIDIVKNVFDTGVTIIGHNAYRGTPVEIRNFGVFQTKVVQGRDVSLNNVSSFGNYTKFTFKPSCCFTKRNRADIGEIKK